MANITSGTSVSASNFNALFTRLDTIRKNHLNKNGQNSTANSAFATAFTTTVAKAGEKPVPNNIQKIKDNLTTLSKSEWLNTTFASKITVPSAGTLLKATDFNTIDNTIYAVEQVCPNYSKYSEYYVYYVYDQYSQYSEFTQYYASGGCFLEGTEIKMADGSVKYIEDLISGDEILAYDENTKENYKSIVVTTKSYLVNKLINIILANGTIIKLTPNHPVLSTKGWASLDLELAKKEHGIETIPLEKNMKIITLNREIEIIDIIEEVGSFNVYNLEIADFHTYFANNVVAHNGITK